LNRIGDDMSASMGGRIAAKSPMQKSKLREYINAYPHIGATASTAAAGV
jgi:hypothetical protein